MKRGTGFSVLVLIVVALAGYLAYTRVFRPQENMVCEVVVCTECRHVFETRFAMGKGGAPYVCPECGAKSAYLAFQCMDPSCQAIFPVRWEEIESEHSVACPVCGGRSQRLFEVPAGADLLADKAVEHDDD